MQRLILFRHGKAEADSPSGEDFERRLTPKGARAAAAMGQRLAELGFAPDVALVSEAARTRETWTQAEPAFPAARAVIDRDLYNAGSGAVRAAALAAAPGDRTVMVVGHNPGLQELAAALLIEGAASAHEIGEARRHFPPAAAAVFAFDREGRPRCEGLLLPERER